MYTCCVWTAFYKPRIKDLDVYILRNALPLLMNTTLTLNRVAGYLLLVFLPLLAGVAWAVEPIGHVLLVTGEAARVDAEGNRQPLADKAAVYEGDTLETGIGAMVQLKMVDNALLVLQPQSALAIKQYNFNGKAEDYAVRLDLIKGRARSVTGELGEANHDAFRLNTPIAAIGIRGTDFETTTTSTITRVRLNSGAIVIAPLGDDCPASALGPCANNNSLVLSEDLASPIAELRATDAAPRIIDLPDYESNDQGGINNSQQEEEQIHTENQAERLVSRIGRNTGEEGLPEEPGVIEPPAPVIDNIHWGRWENINGLSGATVSDLSGTDKELLFRNDLFVLFRDGFLQLGAGQASFNLSSYEAGVLTGDQFSPVTVTNGSLFINFDERKFDTALTFGSGVVAGLELSASGAINGQGLFGSDQGGTRVLGGLTDDNNQVGYLFTHDLGNDMSLQGATQWQRP